MSETINQQTPEKQSPQQSEQLQLASLELQIAQTKSSAEFNSSDAGQIQRQFEAMQRVGKAYADSTIVPKAYQGNIGNCIIALEISHRMNIPPMMVMQNLYVVNGNPTWSSKFLVASINTCGRYTTLRYRKRTLGKLGKVKYNATEYDKAKGHNTTVVREFDATGIDNVECVAYATEKATGQVFESDPVTIEMAIKEGWYTKTGSKWVTMPMLMLTYRAAAFWQRVYAPEVSMGFLTREEAEDDVMDNVVVDTAYEDVAPKRTASVSADDAKQQMRDKAKSAAADAETIARRAATPLPFDMP